MAWAISAVETGYWYKASTGNNLFGMKKNGRGFYTSLRKGGYCLYPSEQHSVADYAGYEAAAIAKYGIRSRSQYLAHVYRRYCPNPVYPGRLRLAFQTLAEVRSMS